LLTKLKKTYLELINLYQYFKDLIIQVFKSNNKNEDPASFLGLITRCKDEYFIKEFCDYYINQGVDRIYIIDDNSNDKSIYHSLEGSSNITIIYELNIIKSNYANKLYKKIKSNFKWIIYVDVDEFITTKRDLNKSIRDELLTTFKNVDCIKIPWIMMSCRNIKESPKSILQTNIYRWNHNKKHPNSIHKFRCRYNEIEVKCIFKTESFSNIWDHHPRNPSNRSLIVNSINLNKEDLNPFYRNLREEDIKNGILLCYHYRIISIDNSVNKIKTNYWYKKNKYTVNDLMASDHAEIIDTTLRGK
jgi:hypothetical protein